jgi:hypothetical protein
LRTLLVVVALASLPLVVVVRELRHRAELQRQHELAEADFRMAQAAVDQYFTQLAEQSADSGPRNDELRGKLLEQSLKFYEGAETNATTPEEKAKADDRIRRIRKELDRDQQSDPGQP